MKNGEKQCLQLVEAGRLLVKENADGSPPYEYDAIFISEGLGSSGYYPAEFFTAENARALAANLSFPGHPEDSWRPDRRDPLSAIGVTSETVEVLTLEDGKKALGGKYSISKTRPDVATYLAEFGSKLGLSIYAEGDGEWDEQAGVVVMKTLNPAFEYRSVDLVVAAGRGGKFIQAEAALRRITQASAPAEEEKEKKVDLEREIAALKATVESLVAQITTLVTAEGAKAEAEAQAKVDEQAVQAAVETRLEQFAADSTLITEAGLTKSQRAEAEALAKSGGDVKSYVEKAKEVLAEAKALAGADPKAEGVNHAGGSVSEAAAFGASLPGFGKVR